jgi:hypothetical protein
MPLISLFTSNFKPIGNSFKGDRIPTNDFNYVIIPNNDLTYIFIPDNDIFNTFIVDNDVQYVLIPDNDINNTLIPSNDIIYTLIPNNDGTYTLIPNNDITYSLLQPSPSPSPTPSITPSITPTSSESPTPTPSITPTSTPTYYYYYLLNCNLGDNKYGRSITSSLSGNSFNVDTNTCYTIVGIDLGPNYDYDLDIATLVTDCTDVLCGPTPTPTVTQTITPTASITPTPTQTLTPTPTPTPTSTKTPTPTPSITPTNSITPTVTVTPTNSVTPTISVTPTSTITPTPSSSPAAAGALQFYLQAAPSSGTVWTDTSGKGKNATINGSYTYVSNNGGGIKLNNTDFTGTGYISVPYNISGTTSTIEIVASFNPTSYWSTIWGNEAYNFSKGYFAYMGTSTNLIWGSPTTNTTTANITASNSIRHWVFVIDGTSKSLYLNGTLLGSTVTLNNPAGGYATNDFYFGARHTNVGTGAVDKLNSNVSGNEPVFYQMRVYNTALNSSEVTTNFNEIKTTYGL